MQKRASPAFHARRLLVVGCVLVSAAGLIWRAVDLQLNDHAFLKHQGDARHLRVEPIPTHRGVLFDRNGEPLAVSTPVASVWIDPQEIALPHPQWRELEAALGLASGTTERLLKTRSTREFVYLRRHVDPRTAEAVSAMELTGVYLQREYRRYYPMGEAAGHIIGFTNIDDVGQEGFELMFEEDLSGEHGAKRVIKDRYRRIVETVERISPAYPGRDLVLSIDRRIQSLTYRALLRAVKQHRAQAGSAVVLDVRTGEVLALANQPSFNPNDRTDRVSRRFRNRAVTDLLEPGSTVKPFTIAAALEAGIVQPDSIVDTRPGFLRVGRYMVRDFRNYGVIDVENIIKKSSNVGAGKLGLILPSRDLWHMFNRAGFGVATESGFPGEAIGTLTDFTDWRDVHRVTLSYGYGLSITALQLARAYAMLGNDGVLPAISFLKIDEVPPASPVMSIATVMQVRRMLEGVVEPGGTGSRARVDGYRVGGKTGTTRKSEAGGYSKDRYHSVFAGLAPMSDPVLSVVVVIDEPSASAYYGGEVAAPVFSDIVRRALWMLGVAPDDPSMIRRDEIGVATPSFPQSERETL